MGREYLHSLVGADTKVNGGRTSRRVKVPFSIITETYSWETGRRECRKEKVYTVL